MVGLLLTALLLTSSSGFGEEPKPSVSDSGKASSKTPTKAENIAPKRNALATQVSPEREAAVIAFAQQNHPELVSLLLGLKQNAPKEYQAALAELDRTVEQLAKSKEKSPDRYEFLLADWKLTSRIRLLAAKLAMADDPVLEGELHAALRERLELRLASQKTERERLQKRIEKLDQTISDTTSKSDALIEKQLAELRSKRAVPKAAGKSKAKRPVAAGQTDQKGDKE